MSRMTLAEYAESVNRHPDRVQAWCRNAVAGYPNKRLPKISARKMGRDWMIDIEGTERAQALASKNPHQRDSVRKKHLYA